MIPRTVSPHTINSKVTKRGNFLVFTEAGFLGDSGDSLKKDITRIVAHLRTTAMVSPGGFVVIFIALSDWKN